MTNRAMSWGLLANTRTLAVKTLVLLALLTSQLPGTAETVQSAPDKSGAPAAAAPAKDAGTGAAPSKAGGAEETASAGEVLKMHAPEAKEIINQGLASLKTFNSDEAGVSMIYPGSFTFKASPVGEVGLFGVQTMGGIVNVSWSLQKLDEKTGTTLDAYAENNKNSVAKLDMEGYKFGKFVSDKTVKVGNYSQRRILVDAETPSPGGAVKLKQLMSIIVLDGTGYVMCGTAPDDYFSFVEPLFNQMADSFKKNPPAKTPAKS